MLAYGYPNLKYFEIFAGQHPSEKIYSVQVKEWNNKYPNCAAVIQTKEQELSDRIEHLRVSPTDELVQLMSDKGIELPNEIYVHPVAYKWVEVVGQKKNNFNTKMILAAIVAAVSFLK